MGITLSVGRTSRAALHDVCKVSSVVSSATSSATYTIAALRGEDPIGKAKIINRNKTKPNGMLAIHRPTGWRILPCHIFPTTLDRQPRRFRMQEMYQEVRLWSNARKIFWLGLYGEEQIGGSTASQRDPAVDAIKIPKSLPICQADSMTAVWLSHTAWTFLPIRSDSRWRLPKSAKVSLPVYLSSEILR